MSPSSSPAFSLRRASLRANTRLIISLVIGVIGIAAVALFYELRHDTTGKRPDKVKVKAPKEDKGKKHKKNKNKDKEKASKPTTPSAAPAPKKQP